jgi:putative membrane protein
VNQTTTARALASATAIASIALASLAVGAQTPPGPGAPGAPRPGPADGPRGARLPQNDAEFVRMLDRANTLELDEAKYVVSRTKDPAVHQFAQHMIDDHSTAAVKLEAATRGTNLRPTPPSDNGNPPGPTRGLMRLESLTGAQLDTDYMRMQVPAHQRALSLLNWEAQNGTNTGLKTLATSLIPTVQQHLQIAQTYLSNHGLTPYTAPGVNPVPGNPNPGNRGAGGPGGPPNNPAVPNAGGSTSGQGNATGGTQPNTAPVTGPTYQPLGSGTPPPGAGPTTAPTPAPSASPHP